MPRLSTRNGSERLAGRIPALLAIIEAIAATGQQFAQQAFCLAPSVHARRIEIANSKIYGRLNEAPRVGAIDGSYQPATTEA